MLFLFYAVSKLLVNDAYVARLRAFFALNNFKLYFVAVVQLSSTSVIGMNENVLATIVRSDKSKTFAWVEKLYFTCLQNSLSVHIVEFLVCLWSHAKVNL